MFKEIFIGAIALAAASRVQDRRLLDLNLNRQVPAYVPPVTEIILPTFNDGSVIDIALQSITDQTIITAYPDRFTITVVDQGFDVTPDVVARYPQVRYKRSEKGYLHARDKGIRESQAEVIVGIDSDAYYPPAYLALLLNPFQDPSVVASLGVTSNFTGGLDDLFTMPLYNIVIVLLDKITKRIPGLANAVRREAYLRVGGFDLSMEKWKGEMISSVQVECEFKFANKLEQIGRIVFSNALTLHWNRRWLCFYSYRCRLNPTSPLCDYCGNVGTTGTAGRY